MAHGHVQMAAVYRLPAYLRHWGQQSDGRCASNWWHLKGRESFVCAAARVHYACSACSIQAIRHKKLIFSIVQS